MLVLEQGPESFLYKLSNIHSVESLDKVRKAAIFLFTISI